MRLALADLGWIPKHWATWGEIKFLTFSTANPATITKFFKLFENLGEAAPQLALAMTYYINNQDIVYCIETEEFPYLPTSLISIILSTGSLMIGIVTGLLAGRDVCTATSGGQYEDPPLMKATKEGSVEKVKMLLRIEGTEDVDYLGECLFQAFEAGHLEIMKMLLAAGADTNKADHIGNTALILASVKGHLDIVKMLLNEEADTNKANHNGTTALILASMKGHSEIVKMLLNEEADTNGQGQIVLFL